MKTLSFVAAVTLLSFVCSCNSEDSAKKEQTSTSTEAQNQPAHTEIKDDVSQKDVIQVAMGSKDHSTLVAAIKQAELVEPLKKSGPFTVFAPTNAAFDKLPKGTLEDLMKPENKEKLADILQYHVSVGIYKEEMMQDGQSIGEVNSQNIKITKAGDKIKVNGTANIVGVVPASNGLIYVIDEVLLPPKK
jgi:uncharacterized surface protein with fasciclin (FAS1) repeats